MRPETAGCLADALLAAERISEALNGIDPSAYEESWQLQSVVERQFLILGEAIVRIRQLEPSIYDRLPDSDSIVRFRNLLVHAYDQIDSKRVYAIAKDDLPAFVPVLTQLVAEAEAQGL